jgi:hypothetical protein
VPIQPDASELATAQLSGSAKFAVFVGILAFLAGFMAYLTLPVLLVRRLCPPATVWSHSSGSPAIIVFGVLLIIVAAGILLVRYGAMFAASQSHQLLQPRSAIFVLPHRQVAITVIVLCGASAFIWVNSLESFYCVTPERILISNGILKSRQLRNWDDVSAVRAECGIGRGNFLWGELRATFNDGTEIELPLRSAMLRLDYKAVRSALAGKHYKYHLSTTVVPTLCPPSVYELLANWQPA